MKWALETHSNSLVTVERLKELRAVYMAKLLEEPDAERLIRAALNVGILCPECKNPVFIQALHLGNKFKLAGEAVTKKGPEWDVHPKFSHFPWNSPRNNGAKPVKQCSLYIGEDVRFEAHVKKQVDPEIRKRISETLMDLDVREFNRAMIEVLYVAATKRTPSSEAINQYEKMGLDFFGGYEVLIHHPYIMPFAVMSQVPHFMRPRRDGGGDFKVKFREVDEDYILYPDRNGEMKQVRIPGHLKLFMKARRGGWKEMNFIKTEHVVSLEAACAATKMPIPPRLRTGEEEQAFISAPAVPFVLPKGEPLPPTNRRKKPKGWRQEHPGQKKLQFD